MESDVGLIDDKIKTVANALDLLHSKMPIGIGQNAKAWKAALHAHMGDSVLYLIADVANERFTAWEKSRAASKPVATEQGPLLPKMPLPDHLKK